MAATKDKGITTTLGNNTEVVSMVRDSAAGAMDEWEQINRVRQRASTLAELSTMALRGEPIQQLMDKAVIEIAKALDVVFCKILRLLPEQGALLLCAGTGWKEGLTGETLVPSGSESQAGYTLLTNEPVIVEDFATETRFTRPVLLADHEVVSGVSIIIQGVSGPWGVLGVHSKSRRIFSQDDVNFVQTVSNILAEAIERKSFIDDLRRSEEKFRGLVETAPDGIAITNSDGEIEMVNKQLERMTGYSREELIGRRVEILVPARFRRHELRRKEFMRNPYTRPMGERARDLYMRRRDGSEFPVEISLAPLETERGMIISSVIRDITERKRVELQNQESQVRLRNLAQRLQTAREEERTTVAMDIHDELGQMLTRLKIDLFGLSGTIPLKPKDMKTRINATIALVETSIDFVRRLSTSLRPAILDDLGLAAAIEWQVQGFADRTGCMYSLDLEQSDLGTNREVDTTVFRIFQESLTNVARHARADNVDISLYNIGEQLVLSVKDNGVGMEQDKLTNNQSLGLIGMHERATAIGGELEIETKKGKGTRITLKVPLVEQGVSH